MIGNGALPDGLDIGLKAFHPANEGRWKCRVQFPALVQALVLALAHRVTLMILPGETFRR